MNRFEEAMRNVTKNATSDAVRDLSRAMFLLGAMRVREFQQQIARETVGKTVEAYSAGLEELDDELDQCVYTEPLIVGRMDAS